MREEFGIRNVGAWIAYSAIYVVSFAGLSLFLWFNLEERQPDRLIDLLAKVSAGSLGIALFAGLSWEVTRSMVLFAPMLKKKLIDQGREEGLEQGREQGLDQGRREGLTEGQQKERQRWQAWLKRSAEAAANNQPFNEPPPSEED